MPLGRPPARIRLGHLHYVPSHRDAYDPRSVNSGQLHGVVDVQRVESRKITRFIVTLAGGLNRQYPFFTTIFHDRAEHLVTLWISARSGERDFSDDDFELLRGYLRDTSTHCQRHGAKLLKWNKGLARRTIDRLWTRDVHHYSGRELLLLPKKKRTYEDDLALAVLDERYVVRRVKSAFRKNPAGTIAHITTFKDGSPLQRKLLDIVAGVVQPGSWEDHALRMVTKDSEFASSVRAAWAIDHDKTVELLELCGPGYKPKANKVLGDRLRRPRKRPSKRQGRPKS